MYASIALKRRCRAVVVCNRVLPRTSHKFFLTGNLISTRVLVDYLTSNKILPG